MTIKESIEQLEGLIEAWQLNDADLNQTDIDAIKNLLNNRKILVNYLDQQIEKYNKKIKEYMELQQNNIDTDVEYYDSLIYNNLVSAYIDILYTVLTGDKNNERN